MLPKPGEGPSPEAQRKGFFDLRFVGTTADGRQIRTKVTGDRDPGYGSTGKMLGQAAACLALDVDKAATPGGFWTPATIFGDRLIQRLTAHSGLTFELVPDWKPGPRPIDNSAPITLVSQTLGHADLKTTSVYAHAPPNESSSRFLKSQ